MSRLTFLSRRQLLFSFIFVGVLLPAILIWRVTPRTNPEFTVWSADSGRRVPKDFAYVLFPKNSSVKLLGPDGREVDSPLKRAIACTEEELNLGKPVGVWNGKEEVSAEKSDLTFDPSGPDSEAYIENWVETVKSWGHDTDWPVVSVTWKEDGPHEFRVTLSRMHLQGDEDHFVYRVESDNLIPERWERISSKAKAFRRLP